MLLTKLSLLPETTGSNEQNFVKTGMTVPFDINIFRENEVKPSFDVMSALICTTHGPEQSEVSHLIGGQVLTKI